MTKKSFLLVSLKENKAKKLAEVISNKTCRKILDYLSDKKDATESSISKDLKIPISTVHYNMKALMTARLVKSDEYHYSEKGKEVSHYYLANQCVIIAPEGDTHAIREKLKSIIPTALIMGFVAGVIKMFSSTFSETTRADTALMMKNAGEGVYGAATPMVAPMMEEAAYEVAQDATVEIARNSADEAVRTAAPEVVHRTVELSHAPEIALWFFIGAVAGVGVYILVDYIVTRIRDR